MPQRVRGMQESPVIAPASGRQCIERGALGRRRHRGPLSGWRHRNPLFAPGSPRLRTPEPAPRRAGALGGAILHAGHDYARAKAHAIDMDVDESRLTPRALDVVLRVRRVEALDAAA